MKTAPLPYKTCNEVFKLSQEDIELANAHGPYVHGTWVAKGLSYGNEEALSGRGEFLATQIRNELLSHFSLDQIREMTIVDVGCYDGWLLCQLEDLQFAKLVGVEPRQKNIDKGNAIREILGIKTRCDFRRGAIENLNEILEGESVDIVVCTGLFHHLSSPLEGVKSLRKICRKFLFLETLCLSVGIEDGRLKEALELKDLPYLHGEKGYGVTGHKLESEFYDGSAVELSVVSIPSRSALELFLETGGFDNLSVVVDSDAYRREVPPGFRKYSAICITACPRLRPMDSATWIEEEEAGMCFSVLPPDTVGFLYQQQCEGTEFNLSPEVERLTSNAAEADLNDSKIINKFARQILKCIGYAPVDKICFEYGKWLLSEGRYEDGEEVLLKVVRRMNADWRSFYRACALISMSARTRGDSDRSFRYLSLLQISNPKFPKRLIEESLTFNRVLTTSR